MTASSKDRGWQDFLRLCQQAESSAQLDELFQLVFTPEERKHMALRTQIVKTLLKGNKTQRELAEDAGISIAKITRGSNALKSISKNLKTYLIKKLI